MSRASLSVPTGTRLSAVSRGDGIIKIWDAHTARTIRTIRNAAMLAFPIWSPNGQMLATIDLANSELFEMKRIKIWDLAFDQRETAHVVLAHTGAVRSVAFSPNNALFASAGADETIKVWNASDGRERLVLRGNEGPLNEVNFSPDNARLVSAGSNGIVKVWNLNDGLNIMEIPAGRSHDVRRRLFADSLERYGILNSSTVDDSAQESTSQSGQLDQAVSRLFGEDSEQRNNEALSVSYSPDGRLLAILSFESARICDPGTGEVIHETGVSAGNYNNLAFTSNGSQMALPSGSMGMTEFLIARTGEAVVRLNEYVSE